jgi:hypothetical protein
VLNTTVPSRFKHIVGSNLGNGETTSNEVWSVRPCLRQLNRTQLSQLAARSVE